MIKTDNSKVNEYLLQENDKLRKRVAELEEQLGMTVREFHKCTKCGEIKSRNEFYTVRGKRTASCKSCQSQYHKEYYLRTSQPNRRRL